jgi:PEP-CTERM motif
MRNDRCPARGLPAVGARLARTLATLAGPIALAAGIGAAAPDAAFAQTVKDATFNLSLEVLGADGGGLTAPGTDTIDDFCRTTDSCGSASGTLTSNFNGVQSISGSATTNQDLGAQASATVDFYFMIKGPKNAQVTYHLKASGSTSVFGGGQATALFYLNGTLLNYACSSSMTKYCVVSDHFQFDTDFSAISNTQEVLEIDLNGGTAAYGGGPFTASADPIITVDPLYANQGYSLELSPNVTEGSLASSAPEPGTWAMALLGFAALGFAYRARRRGAVAH